VSDKETTNSADIGAELDPRPVGPTCPFIYRHRQVILAGPGKMDVKPTPQGHFVLWAILIIGLAGMVASFVLLSTQTWNMRIGWVIGLLGLGISALGAVALWDCSIRVTFDRRSGRFRSNRPLITPTHFTRLDDNLDNIAALQICRGHSAFSRRRGYQWHQLNLVLHDPPGKRVPLMTQVGAETVRADAEALAEFLDCPVLEHSTELPRRGDTSKKLRRALGPVK